MTANAHSSQLSSSPLPSIKISNGRLIDPASDRDEIADIYIVDGIIQAITTNNGSNSNYSTTQEQPQSTDLVIEAKGQWVIPGAVDLSARTREPGQEFKGTIYSETKAAAAGGITHLCCPPDTQPIIDSAAVAALIQERAHQAGYAHILPIGAMTQGLNGSQLSEMYSLQEAGCIGITQLRHAIKDNRVLLRCLEYAATFNLTVFFQSVDLSLQGDGIVHEGFNSTRLGLPGIPHTAETVALARDLLLVEQTGVNAHFGQLSCARSVEIIAAAQKRNLPVTADVAAHQLFFNNTVIDEFESQYYVNPPFRDESDREALIQGICNDTISAICSDHQPHETTAKSAPFGATESGISTLETFLPTTYSLVQDGLISVKQWVSCIATTPAKIINIEAGQVAVDQMANLSIFDPALQWHPNVDTLLSEGKNTPYLGRTLQGRTTTTLLDGRLVYQL